MRTLTDKKCLVTGAATGIGRAIALRLADEGAHVYLLDVNPEGLEATAQEARARGVQAIGYKCDVSNVVENDAAVDQLLGRWQFVDVLINNAGVCYYGPTTEMTRAQMDRLMAINLHAPMQFTTRLLPTLLARPEAHVLNVASMYGLIATNRCLAYHTSKFAMVGFSEALRLEYDRLGLGVTALCPGFVTTDLFTSMVDDTAADQARRPPAFLCTTPEKVANRAIRAIYRDQRLALVTPLAHFAYHSRRLMPGLMDWLHRFRRSKNIPSKEDASAQQRFTAKLMSKAA